MLAVLPGCVVSWLLVIGPCLPNFVRNLPSRVNFSSDPSLLLLPVSQTWFFASTMMPCSLSGQSGLKPEPPQAWTTLPAASNSTTDGAGTQHLERGGLRVAPRSASLSER